MELNYPLLSFVIWLPILGGLVVLSSCKDKDMLAKRLALSFSILTLLFSLLIAKNFDISVSGMQMIERVAWVPTFNIQYFLGVDGISLAMVLLTTIICVLVILSEFPNSPKKIHYFLAAILILEGFMLGVFLALDAILFYVFWEALLIPMFILIGIWGGPNRVYATIKFFLYTFFGSVFMLISFLYLYQQGNSFSILDFHTMSIGYNAQILIFIAFLLAFAVKVPMFPVHTWLPDAHVEAPTAGSVLLAAITLKMGGYGFLRFSLPITPDAAQTLDVLVIILSLIAIIYIGFIALVQKDMKKLVAYSSISHMGIVTLGIFIIYGINSTTGNYQGAVFGFAGAMIQMISHGFISAAMFLCIGILYNRVHSRNIADYGGVVNVMPKFAVFAILFAMANAGLPGTSGFIGEFMVILSAFKSNPWYGILAAFTLIIGAAYTLWMVKRVYYGKVISAKVAALQDINRYEFAVLLILTILTIGLGVYPAPVIEILEPSLAHLLEQAITTKL